MPPSRPNPSEVISQLNEILSRALPKDVSNTPDAKYQEEKHQLEKEEIRARLKSFRQDTDERKKYAHRIFCLLCTWLICVGVILLLQGDMINGFELDKEIIVALIGGTTASVIGIFLIVAQYLFPKR